MTYSGGLDYESTTEEKIILHNTYQIYQFTEVNDNFFFSEANFYYINIPVTLSLYIYVSVELFKSPSSLYIFVTDDVMCSNETLVFRNFKNYFVFKLSYLLGNYISHQNSISAWFQPLVMISLSNTRKANL